MILKCKNDVLDAHFGRACKNCTPVCTLILQEGAISNIFHSRRQLQTLPRHGKDFIHLLRVSISGQAHSGDYAAYTWCLNLSIGPLGRLNYTKSVRAIYLSHSQIVLLQIFTCYCTNFIFYIALFLFMTSLSGNRTHLQLKF